jgi:predicted enzyme related to lactoylglutathione lyase
LFNAKLNYPDPMNGHIYIEIHVDNQKRASEFYSKIFGWTFHEHESQKDTEGNTFGVFQVDVAAG